MSMLSNDIGYCREKKLMKSILVPTGGSDTDSPLFETALAVARLFSSHLQFLHIHIGAGEAALNVPHAEFAMGPALSNALEELEQSATIRSATAFRHFRDFCARSSIAICDAPTYPTGVTASWHEQPGKALKRIMFFARHSDLVVVGRARKANGMTTDFIEQLLVKSGRPVLIAPSAPRQTLANTIMVCWRETAETVRAFNFHHKTGAVVLHPLQDSDGTLFYGDAEEVLAKVPRRGIPLILHETATRLKAGDPSPPNSTPRVAWPNWFADCATRPDHRRRSPSMHADMVE
jgi:hypothetical protein